jgi:peroxiredoxin-like protein
MQSAARDARHTWQTSLTWIGDRASLQAADRTPIGVTIPPQFGGPGDQWSPEELLIGAAQSCTVATFISLAKRRGVGIVSVSSSGRGTVARSDTGMSFSEVTLELRVIIEDDKQRDAVAALVERAHRGCIVSSSLRCPVTVTAVVDAIGGRAHGSEGRP